VATVYRLHAAALLGLVLAAPPAGLAHEIPSDITIRMIVRPTTDHLEALVRVPR